MHTYTVYVYTYTHTIGYLYCNSSYVRQGSSQYVQVNEWVVGREFKIGSWNPEYVHNGSSVGGCERELNYRDRRKYSAFAVLATDVSTRRHLVAPDICPSVLLPRNADFRIRAGVSNYWWR